MWFYNYTNNNQNKINNIRGITPKKTNQRISFKQVGVEDTFHSNSPAKLFNEIVIRKLISQNPEITRILDENKLPIHLNIKELQELKNGHCQKTQDYSVAIFNNLPKVLKDRVNTANLKDGAFLHDFGKVLIPPEILNKTTKLTPQEHKIMDLHTELGYQLIKNTEFNDEVKSMIRMHHSNYEKTASGTIFVPNIELQIINLADKFSALTEKRTYKDAYSTQKALEILQYDVEKGRVHPLIYKALTDAVKNHEIA